MSSGSAFPKKTNDAMCLYKNNTDYKCTDEDDCIHKCTAIANCRGYTVTNGNGWIFDVGYGYLCVMEDWLYDRTVVAYNFSSFEFDFMFPTSKPFIQRKEILRVISGDFKP